MRMYPVVGTILLACAGADPAPSDDQELARGDEPEPTSVVEQGAASVPTDWVPFQASCGYAFRAPPELMMQALQGTDSCVDGWATGNCVYHGDYGGFSSDLREYQEALQYEETQESIDGHAAKVVTAVSDEFLIAAVSFPRVDQENERIRLTIAANCQDGPGQQDALRIFRTITFAPRG